MRALNGSDAFHLRREDAGQPAHTIKVAVLGPGAEPLDPGAVVDWARATLPVRDPFRWQLQPVPLRLGRPAWRTTSSVDPAWHVVHRPLGGDESLDDVVGGLAGGRLPRDRPLWRLWIVDGLDGGRVALVMQLHHALADGAASVRIWEELFGPGSPSTSIETTPRWSTLVGSTLHRHVRSARQVPALLRRLRASDQRRRALAAGAGPVPEYFEGPVAAFNTTPSSDRVCTFVTLPLDDLRSVARRLGGTVNDVYAALCSGALRSYLDELGELPEVPMTATAPVGLERRDGSYGNSMTSWFWTMATHEPEPIRRFEIIRSSLSAARELQEEDPRLLADLQDHAFTYEVIWRMLQAQERRKGRPMLNTIVSNVRGPEPLEWQGHPVLALQSVGPLTGRMGLNFTAWSYGDDFTVGLHACRRAVPDLARLGQLLTDELAVLTAAAPEGTDP